MISESNCNEIQQKMMSNLSEFLPQMIHFKTKLQNDILPFLSTSELEDIKNSKLNKDVVHKLAYLGRGLVQQTTPDTTIYCVCMAIGTIIKEYGWGTTYIYPEGICELAKIVTT